MLGDIHYRDLFHKDFEKTITSNAFRIKLIVLNTNWSGTGQMLDEIIQDVSVEYHPYFDFYRVDADANPKLVNHLGIRKFPTMLFFQQGEVVAVLPGLISEDRLRGQLRKMAPGLEEE
jgi:thioredoxin-like negative regulator of GroEL